MLPVERCRTRKSRPNGLQSNHVVRLDRERDHLVVPFITNLDFHLGLSRDIDDDDESIETWGCEFRRVKEMRSCHPVENSLGVHERRV